jgi:hypothetical protein
MHWWILAEARKTVDAAVEDTPTRLSLANFSPLRSFETVSLNAARSAFYCLIGRKAIVGCAAPDLAFATLYRV